jgi:hypothetical protein
VAIGKPEDIAPETLVHRIGGAEVPNLRLSTLDSQQNPPGLSVLLGGLADTAAQQMIKAFPRSRKWQKASRLVGTALAGSIRQAGFDVVPDPTDRFPNHGRLIHPNGPAGFNDVALGILAQAFSIAKELS